MIAFDKIIFYSVCKQSGNPDQKIIVYFMSSEDAVDYLDEMAQINSLNANEFRIMTVSMEKVINIFR